MIKRVLLALLILILGIVGYYWYMFSHAGKGGDSGPKQPAVELKHHSDTFNLQVSNMLAAYFEMKNAFVEADSIAAVAACKKMIGLTDSINLNELKKDTAGIFATDSMSLENIKLNAQSLVTQTSMIEMKKDFSMVSENLYPFLKGINYKGPELYWQNCPMAFGEDKEANWLSNTKEIINPYMGKFHPEYKAGMLHCGEVKDSIKTQ